MERQSMGPIIWEVVNPQGIRQEIQAFVLVSFYCALFSRPPNRWLLFLSVLLHLLLFFFGRT